jgi:hypothetical protein
MPATAKSHIAAGFERSGAAARAAGRLEAAEEIPIILDLVFDYPSLARFGRMVGATGFEPATP